MPDGLLSAVYLMVYFPSSTRRLSDGPLVYQNFATGPGIKSRYSSQVPSGDNAALKPLNFLSEPRTSSRMGGLFITNVARSGPSWALLFRVAKAICMFPGVA